MSLASHRTTEEWAAIEAAEHDAQYANQFPFGLKQDKFTIERALWYEDYCYKKGRRRDRGHRTRKFLLLVDLSTLKHKRVLDIGCGIGQYSVLCAMAGATVVGVDLSNVGTVRAREIAAANKVAGQCDFRAGDFSRMEFEPRSFDVVMLHEVLHHAIKYPGIKEKIASLVRPGGKIVVADTVRGGGLVHLGRRLTKYLRYRKQPELRAQHDDLGDVLFGLDTYHEFARGFPHYRIYPMSYLYMVKQTGLQYHLDKLYVRWFLRLVRHIDDALLFLIPPLRKKCGEAILYIEC